MKIKLKLRFWFNGIHVQLTGPNFKMSNHLNEICYQYNLNDDILFRLVQSSLLEKNYKLAKIIQHNVIEEYKDTNGGHIEFDMEIETSKPTGILKDFYDDISIIAKIEPCYGGGDDIYGKIYIEDISSYPTSMITFKYSMDNRGRPDNRGRKYVDNYFTRDESKGTFDVHSKHYGQDISFTYEN